MAEHDDMKDRRLTKADAERKMRGEDGLFVCVLIQGEMRTCFAFNSGGAYSMHIRRDGKIQGAYHYPGQTPFVLSGERPFSDTRINPRIGKMMEGFSDLIKAQKDRSKSRVFLSDGKISIEFLRGEEDEDGDLDLDILRLKVGRSVVSAVAGELGQGILVEHNTFTDTKHRGKGYMSKLYTMLLDEGIVIVSDQYNHSEPMRRVWMGLIRKGYPVYSLRGGDDNIGGYDATRLTSDVKFDDEILDDILVAGPKDDLASLDRALGFYEVGEGIDPSARYR